MCGAIRSFGFLRGIGDFVECSNESAPDRDFISAPPLPDPCRIEEPARQRDHSGFFVIACRCVCIYVCACCVVCFLYVL